MLRGFLRVFAPFFIYVWLYYPRKPPYGEAVLVATLLVWIGYCMYSAPPAPRLEQVLLMRRDGIVGATRHQIKRS
jgi:hypothetical protein